MDLETFLVFEPRLRLDRVRASFASQGLMRLLGAEVVEVVREEKVQGAGRFAWIVDPEGNRVELWEPESGGSGESDTGS